jgi:hypothetical protein
MKRATFFVLVLALCISQVFTSVVKAKVSPEEETLFPVMLRNRTAGQVSISLVRMDGVGAYWLSVAPGAERRFALQGGSYTHTTYACGKTETGRLEVNRGLRLIFTSCPGVAPNPGEPTLEKIHLRDSPRGKLWSYRYGPARPGAGSGSGGAAGGTCQYTATAEVDIYTRPSTSADVFSTQGAGFSIQPSARTADGWLGFDPGVAQAANIGSFRLRWLPPGSGTRTGGCSSLPVVWAPLPGLCYDMPMDTTNVYATPDTSAAVLFVLHLGEFAELLGTTAGGDWAKVDLGPGNTGSHAVGWVEVGSLNVNGPCSGLPTVSP